VVFDAYRLKGHETEIMDYHNIHVVYTKEAETADQYIEKFAHSNGAKYNITVATSDGMEQLIIRGEGCMLLSAREFLEELHRTDEANKEAFFEKNKEELSAANHVMKPLLCGVQIEENKE
jgi:predicted RNA-binding protein with PIN domain